MFYAGKDVAISTSTSDRFIVVVMVEGLINALGGSFQAFGLARKQFRRELDYRSAEGVLAENSHYLLSLKMRSYWVINLVS